MADVALFVVIPGVLVAVDVVRGMIGSARSPGIVTPIVFGVVIAAALFAAPSTAVPVLVVCVIANLTAGATEMVPFSRFEMFSRPATSSRRIMVVARDGDQLQTRNLFGASPQDIVKLHWTLCRQLRQRSDEPIADATVRQTAAVMLGEELERRRAAAGREAIPGGYSILDVQLRLEEGVVVERTEVLTTVEVDTS